jgi:predicted naringenin-chalcone synthase
MNRAYIQVLRGVDAPIVVNQSNATEWLTNARPKFAPALDESAQQKLRKFYQRLGSKTNIHTRRTIISDYSSLDSERWTFFGGSAGIQIPNLSQRMQVYAEAAGHLIRAAYQGASIDSYSHAILVSCTGYDSPSIMQRLLSDGWTGQYLMLGHMGCYATMPAVRMASDLITSAHQPKSKKITIFSCELCTIHLDPTSSEISQQVINMLFADGAIRMDLSNDPNGSLFEYIRGFEIKLPNSSELMTWRPGSHQFSMSLSPEIPVRIGENLLPCLKPFLNDLGIELNEIKYWAIHPGGIRIIETIAETLKLPDEAIRHSLQVYQSKGNMSSATVPHIWQDISQDAKCKAGDYVLSLAFGPGLTMVGNLMRRC